MERSDPLVAIDPAGEGRVPDGVGDVDGVAGAGDTSLRRAGSQAGKQAGKEAGKEAGKPADDRTDGGTVERTG